MKLTGTLVLLGCLLLLVPAGSQRHYRRGRSRGAGRALRRLAVAGLIFGAGTAVGVALGRGRRDVSAEDELEDELGLSEEAVLRSLQEADSHHCMEQWLCDITSRPQDQRAEEEQDMVMLFEEEAAEGGPGSPESYRAVYVAAAARGLRAAEEGDITGCQLPSCPFQPDQLLLQLRVAEEDAAR